MSFVVELGKQDFTERIATSTKFLDAMRRYWDTVMVSERVQVAMSPGVLNLVFGTDQCPDGAYLDVPSRGYRVYKPRLIATEKHRKNLKELLDLSCHEFGVGSFGSIFTGPFRYKGKLVKLTMNDHNPLNGDPRVLYLDACLVEELK